MADENRLFGDCFIVLLRLASCSFLLAVGFVLLGVNKELDFHTLFTAAMKCVAQANGWYTERRQYQELFIIGMVVGGSLLLLSALLYFRRTIRLVALAFVGSALVSP